MYYTKDDIDINKIQLAVDNAFIDTNTEPSAPVDIIAIAKRLGFTIHEFATFPSDVVGAMFLTLSEKLRKLVPSSKLIGLNKNYDLAHKRFAVAHELGHYFLHKDRCLNGANPVFFHTKDDENGIEAEACKFAALILMDKRIFKKMYSDMKLNDKNRDIDIIRTLSKKFNVPQKAIQRRITELGL